MTRRIVSLLASATELVSALGYENEIVGISHECDYPESIRHLPQVSRPKFRGGGSSREIDHNVKEILEKGLGVYHVDAGKLEELKPTHLVTQDHCQVCAVSFQDLENAACEVISSRPKILSVHPSSLDDIWRGYIEVAEGLGDRLRGVELVARLKSRLSAIEAMNASPGDNPIVAHIEWLEPLMSGGNWMPELIRIAGGATAFGEHGGKSPKIKWDDVVAARPDIILVAPCGFTIERTMSEIHILKNLPGWSEMTAVKDGRVYIGDGNQYFNRPGPRVVESCEILAEMIHPEIFSFGHQGKGWIKLP